MKRAIAVLLVLASLARADWSVVVGVDVAEIVKTELYKGLRERLGDLWRGVDETFDAFREATGFDPETDLRSVALGVGDPADELCAILTGRFDVAKLRASERFAVREEEGREVFRLADGSGREFHFPNETTLVFARKGKLPRQLVPPAATEAIALRILLPAAVKALAKKAYPNAPVDEIVSISTRVEVGREAEVSAAIRMETAEAAVKMRAIVAGLVLTGKVMSLKRPEIQPLVDSVRHSLEGDTLKVEFRVTKDLLLEALARRG